MVRTLLQRGKFYFLFALLILPNCAGSPPFSPDQIRQTDTTIRLSRLLESPDDYVGKVVIVGGVINMVERQGIVNRIYVQAYPLDPSYHPDRKRKPTGHFMVVTDQPLSPHQYAPGHTIEVIGQVMHARKMPNFTGGTEKVVVIRARSLHVRTRVPPPNTGVGFGFGYYPMMGF
ncbi:MAG: Slp family lipoprotein [Nitrospirae bacterium]|jgi:outer membrane lipoprotein|nr:Slp family lipoprotein [Nitrospirota bacterium]